MVKIGIVTPYFYPQASGVGEHAYHTYLNLKKLGVGAKIITSSYGRHEEINEDVIRIGRAVPIPSNGSISRVTISYRLSQKIKELLEKEKFDLLHIHEPLSPTLPLLFLKHSPALNVGTFHRYSDSSLAYLLAKPWLKKYFLKLAVRIAVSQAARNFVYKYFSGEMEVIPNGIDIEKFRGDLPKIPRYNDGIFNILFVGRLEQRKGLSYLIKAFILVKRKFKDSRLIVVGDGPLKNYCQWLVPKELKGAVLFEGTRLSIKEGAKEGDLPHYYSTCDLFCSPATGRESFGIVLLEAMASGKPVIASDIDGYREVVTPGKEGILVPPRDEGELALAILKLASDKELRRKMGEEGRKKAIQYSWENITRRLYNLYCSLLA